MKIRILETIRQGLIGGGETHLLSLVKNLNKKVFDPVVLSFTEGPMVDRFKQMGIPTRVIYSETPFDIRVWGKVKSFIREQGIELVHAHGTRAASNTIWASHSLGLPFVYTVHGWSFHDDQRPMTKRFRTLGEQYLVSRAEKVISVSASNQRTGKISLKGFDSVVINNGIDLGTFDPGLNYPDVRAELGIPKDCFLILFLARFTNHKQPLKLIKGFYEASAKVPEMRLLMVGEGDAREDAKKLVAELGIGEKVYFQDFRSDVAAVLAAADVFVLPSLWEGMAISLLEAMAMGKVVVGSRVDGNIEVIRHMENGWLADLENLESNLATAFITLYNEPALRSVFSKNALLSTQNDFSAEKMTRSTEEVYQELLKKKK